VRCLYVIKYNHELQEKQTLENELTPREKVIRKERKYLYSELEDKFSPKHTTIEKCKLWVVDNQRYAVNKERN
jgi:hypothetical protein